MQNIHNKIISNSMAYQFKIKLLNVKKPPVWRRIIIPENYTFEEFHHTIQISFGWNNEHLHKFGNKAYGGTLEITSKYIEEDENHFDFGLYNELSVKNLDEHKTKLSDVFGNGVKKLMYVYDFGDDWIHEIMLEDVLTVIYPHPVCTAGKGCCPPENCGGPMAYEMMKNILAEIPNSKEARDIRTELGLKKGEKIDDFNVDLEDINLGLKDIKMFMEEDIDKYDYDLFEPFYDDEWAEQMHCAVTVCDADGKILYMNEKSRATFAKHGDLIGQNLFKCHSPESQAKIRELLATDGTNSYTIEKNGVKKMIYQTTWKCDGNVAGLVEISMEIPETMPHYVRS